MSGIDERLCVQLANVPLARPGFDALTMSSPVLVQMNPEGIWENTKPESLDENSLKAAIQHLVNSNALAAAQSYCHHCAACAKKECGQSTYVPVIMMPVLPANECPFDMEAQIDKMEETETKPTKKKTKTVGKPIESDADKDKKKPKKRGWTMQRLTDFDLLSQW